MSLLKLKKKNRQSNPPSSKDKIPGTKLNRSYIIFGISLVIIFGSTYLIFCNHVEAAIISINKQNTLNKEVFLNSKNTFLKEFADKYPNETYLFNNFFTPNEKLFQKDTLVNFFIYSSKLPIIKYDLDYYRCLILKCEYEMDKIKIDNEIKIKLDKIRIIFGDDVENWYQKIGNDKFLKELTKREVCNQFFEKTNKLVINNAAFIEFQKFLSKINKDKIAFRNQSEESLAKFKNLFKTAYSSLPAKGRNSLFLLEEESNFISETTNYLHFAGEELGSIYYAFPVKEFDENKFDSVLDDIYLESYKDNFLSNGSQPYSYCFGSDNYCDTYGCSKILVKTPNNSDVLVTIKKNDEVYRHAYVRASSSYTFEFPNGTYQIFFYYGSGWNPNKFMKNTNCGELKGGFISDEVFGKDNPQILNNMILTYELILQQNGNFSTKSSNKEEAF